MRFFAWLGPQSATVEPGFELRIEDGRRFWWVRRMGSDATEIDENGVLTLDAAAFAIGTVLTLTEPTEEPMNPLAETQGHTMTPQEALEFLDGARF